MTNGLIGTVDPIEQSGEMIMCVRIIGMIFESPAKSSLSQAKFAQFRQHAAQVRSRLNEIFLQFN